ncbi:DUF4376 domain-containing protein [Pseudomonas sp. FP2196]|uniref:DUF4376 domain-containing protein n=1 Tax=Pseudomonas sp. FP2196 TaxID=2954086 RepID=UPI00273261C1|nr:DUF4376 domain-containing protein [Pseudomonas sp. FP2196]WLH36819.1 DUF4376 domain-containing protein [Pseudomonas sp. FP2196]
MKFATFDENGTLIGRYDSRIHSVIPENAVELDEAVFLATRADTDGIWKLVDGDVVKLPVPEVETNYAALFAAERFAREASGITVDGVSIETTRDSQALIASTGLSAILDPEYRCNFKTLDGFVQINATQILAIAKAVRAHVQACFDRELALLQAIEAGTYTDDLLKGGWPDSAPATLISALQ